MPERFIGLDISSGSVKAVQLHRGFRGGGVVAGFRSVAIDEGQDVAEALARLFSDPIFTGAVCLTSLPSALFSFRNIQLPFRDERKIRQTAAFALEPVIQQPLDKVLIDYSIVEKAKQSRLFAAIVEKRHIEERLATLKPHVRETAVIDIEAVPLAAFLSRRPDVPPCSLLLDVGSRDTTAVFFGKDRLFNIRHFYFGGRNVTEALAVFLGIEQGDAEVLKIKGELNDSGMEAITGILQPFFSELKNTLLFLRQKGEIPELPSKIILTGGGSRTPHLAEGLAALLGVPVEKGDLLSAGGFSIDEKIRASWDGAVMDQALALAARPLGRGYGFNFLQRQQESRVDTGEMRGILRKAAIAAGVIVALGAVELGLGEYTMRLKLARLKQGVVSEYKRIDPEATKIVDPVVQIRGKIAELKKFAAGSGDVLMPSSVLDIFRDISGAAQPEITLSSLVLEEDAVVLKGEAPNFDTMDAFKKKLESSRYLKTVTVGSTGMLKEQKGVEFTLKAARKK